MPLPKYTPWGAPDRTESIAPGIWLIETPSHGGYYLEPAANAKIPAWYQSRTFNRQGLEGFYEEDSDHCLVPVFFPEHFPIEGVANAISYLGRGWIVCAVDRELAA
jgi:hypothetical protein